MVYGAGGNGIVQGLETPLVTQTRSDTRYYFLKDHLGSVRVTVDVSGNVTSYDDFYPFGMTMDGRSGNFGSGDARYKYTTKERDAESGYDYFGARYYDARIGRFFSIDPLSDTPILIRWSPYHYSFDNPFRFTDPKGLIAGDPQEEQNQNTPQPTGSDPTTARQAKVLRSVGQLSNGTLSTNPKELAQATTKTLDELKSQVQEGTRVGIQDLSSTTARYAETVSTASGDVAVGALVSGNMEVAAPMTELSAMSAGLAAASMSVNRLSGGMEFSISEIATEGIHAIAGPITAKTFSASPEQIVKAEAVVRVFVASFLANLQP